LLLLPTPPHSSPCLCHAWSMHTSAPSLCTCARQPIGSVC
jgi:hypothetical protein